jgi:hypothetical protein
MAYSEPQPNEGRALLKIDAQIISEGDDFIIEITNSEKKETIRVDNVRDYAEYLVESVNNSLCDDFVANWLPSPKAKRAHIDLIGMQLGMMQEWMEQNLKTENS